MCGCVDGVGWVVFRGWFMWCGQLAAPGLRGTLVLVYYGRACLSVDCIPAWDLLLLCVGLGVTRGVIHLSLAGGPLYNGSLPCLLSVVLLILNWIIDPRKCYNGLGQISVVLALYSYTEYIQARYARNLRLVLLFFSFWFCGFRG